MESKFKIGDRVKVLPNDEYGTIVDIMFSYKFKENLYEVGSDDDADLFLGKYVARDLAPAPKDKEYSMDIKIDIAQNIVIATLYEGCGELIRKPLKRGHGHIIHDGELGIAQAASYACRRLYESLSGGYTNGKK